MLLADGERIDCLEPRRLFPLSCLDQYVTLLSEDGTEAAIIRDLAVLSTEDRACVEACLDEYYFIPKITRITSLEEKFGMITIEAQTDKGDVRIEIRGIVHSLKLIAGGRVLIRDVNDNRYEIPCIDRLDRRSQQLIDSYL